MGQSQQAAHMKIGSTSIETEEMLKDISFEDTFTMVKHVCATRIAGTVIELDGKIICEKSTNPRDPDKALLKELWKDIKTAGLLSIYDIKHYNNYYKIATTNKSKIACYFGIHIVNDDLKANITLYTCSNQPLKLSGEQLDLFQAQARQFSSHVFAKLALEITNNRLKSTRNILSHHEQNYQSVLDSTGDMMFELDMNGKFIAINQLLKNALGYSEEEFADMHYTDLVPAYKRRKLEQFFEGQLKEKSDDQITEFPFKAKDGSTKWVGLKVAINYPNESERKFVVVARDISREKEATNKLAKYRNGLKLINEIASNANFTLKEQLYMALEVGSSYLGLEVAVIGQVIDDMYYVKFHQLAHPDYGVKLKDSYKLKNVFSDITFRQDDVITIAHSKESEYGNHPCYLELGMESYIGTPYYIKGKKEGTVSFFSLSPRSAFDDNEIDFIKIFARWIGFILERERNQSSLLSEQGMLRAFASFSPAAIAMFDTNMEYLAATEKWIEENNLMTGKILGKNYYEEFPESKEEWKEYHQRALKGEVLSFEEDWYINKKGEKVWLTWAVRPWYTESHEIGGVIIFMQNISLQKQQAEELVKAKEAAEKASQAKDQFLSTMSHEIRTPLNAVIGAGHLLLQEDPREDQIQNMTLLKNSGEHLLSLVNDILDFNKIEEGKLHLEDTSFDFLKLISSIQFAMEQAAQEKNIDFKLEIDQAIPYVLKGDPTRINQILINLLSNAIKFTKVGFVKLAIKLTAHEKENVKLYFEVQDSGIGITQEQLNSIFERFTQADKDTTRKYGGSGLGLTITRRLLEMMGSEIHVKSAPDEGSRFYFDLLLKEGDQNNVVRESTRPTGDIKTASSKRILLVDDHEVNRIMASKFLTKWGLEVDCAENGKACLDMIENQGYDLVLMDLQMPEMDGFEATNLIRARKESYFQQIPIIALTASALVETREEVKRVGMNDYVTKPFNPKVFRNKLSIHLNDPSLAE